MPLIPPEAGRPAWLHQARRFARRRDGNVALLFGLLALPLLGFTGAAIDYGFATYLETKLQAATDATALALCQTPMATTNAALQTQASTMMNGYMGATGLAVDPLTVTANPRQITLTTHVVSPVFFGRITGVTALRPGGSARCATPIPKTFEIALVLDNTGSMGDAGDDGVSKITALRNAAKNFVSYVFSNAAFATGTKIAIVPFAAAVAVDPASYRTASWVDTNAQSAYHWTNVTGASAAGFNNRFDIFTKLKTAYSAWGWAGCFESLPYPQNVTDMATTSGNANTLYVPYFAPDEPGPGAVGYAVWNKTAASYNSYIDDFTGQNGCSQDASSTSASAFRTAESRACKYRSPQTPRSGAIGDLGPNGPNFGCTSQPLQRLTSNTSVLNALIDNMAAAGNTNIHDGLMWGWRTISPVSVFADGAAYSSTTVNKVIVLMTDGDNTWNQNPYSYNSSLFSSYGYYVNADGTYPDVHFPTTNQNISSQNAANAGINALTLAVCANAGRSTGSNPPNVAIYTIGLSTSSAPISTTGQNLLKSCAASSATGQYFPANDSSSLIAAFSNIAKSIGALRLTQ